MSKAANDRTRICIQLEKSLGSLNNHFLIYKNGQNNSFGEHFLIAY